MSLTRFLIVYSIVASVAHGQLYLLAGSPSQDNDLDSYASALFRVDNDSNVTLVTDLVPQSVGIYWIGVSYDWRKFVILPKNEDNILIVFDFNKAAPVKKCGLPQHSEQMRLKQWLADPPARGPSFVWYSCGADITNNCSLQAMVLDPEIGCDRSFATLPWVQAGDMVAHGQPGSSGFLPSDGIPVYVDGETGGVEIDPRRPIALPYQVPSALRKGIAYQSEWALINDSHVFVLSLAQNETSYRLLEFRKRDKTWHVLPFSSERFPHVRGFGKFIAATEVRTRGARNPNSVGMSEWRRVRSKMGPSQHPRNNNEV